MKPKYIKIFISVLLLFLLFNRCYPTYQATKVDTDSIGTGNYSDLQVKLFNSDNSIILFPDGFNINNKSIWGTGILQDNKTLKSSKQIIELPLDSITAMITYEETTSGGRYFASFFLGLTSVPLTFLGV